MRGGGAGGAGGAGGHLPADGGAAQPRGTRAQSVGMRLRALTARGVSAEWWHLEPPGLPPPPPPARAGTPDPAGNEPRNCGRGGGEGWKRGAWTGTSGPLSPSSARELRGGGRAPPHLPRFILDGGVSSGSLFARPPRPAFLRAAGRGGGRGDTRRDAAGPPPRRASPGSDGSERRCAPHRQPRARSGDTRGAPALRTLQRARMRTRDARRRGRCGVRVGSAATHRPNALRRGAGPADPRRCGHGPLKLARLPAPRFYGPICLRRALPSPVNHSTRGGGSGR